jgi:hypothetical protein
MRPTTTCRLQTLAATSLVKVEHCEHCGVVAVHMGAFSFRVDEAALDDLSDALDDARRQLHGASEHHGELGQSREYS